MFIQQLTRPAADDAYYSAKNPYAWSGYGMPNCTTYVFGRWYAILGTVPKLCRGNAEDYYGYEDGYQRGQVPKLGAIMCWAKGKTGNSADGAGHVAVVEQVNADGSVITSESGYKSAAYWWRKTRSKGNGNWGQSSEYTYQGCIYLPENVNTDVVQAAKNKLTSTVQLPTLMMGSSGQAVKALQAILTAEGYATGGTDGEFGRNTCAALTAYQRAHGLTADGICGKETWSKLLGIS